MDVYSEEMIGIVYDRNTKQLRRIDGPLEPSCALVTHNLGARRHRCRRILQEWLPANEVREIDFSPLN